MGYAHYFTQNRDVTEREWQNICDRFRELFQHSECPNVESSIDAEGRDEAEDIFCQNSVHHRAIVSSRRILFNGDQESGNDHETFVIERCGRGFAFCKTAEKPYDLFVVATLLIAHREAPGAFSISSDGDASDWRGGAELVAVTYNVDVSDVEIPEEV